MTADAASTTVSRQILADLWRYLPAKIVPALTPLITVPVYTHLFTPHEYGLYVLAFGVAELLLAVAATGLATGAVRFYALYRREQRLASYFTAVPASLGFMIVASTGITVLVLLAFRSRIAPDVYPLLWIALPAFIAAAVSEVLMNILRAQERSRSYALVEVANRAGTVITSLALVFLCGLGVSALLWGQALTLTVIAIPLAVCLTRGIRLDRRTHQPTLPADLRRILGFSLPLAVGNIAFWVLRLSDRYFIEGFRDSHEVGLYSISYNVASRSIFLVVGLFMLVPGPIMMRTWENEGREAAEAVLTRLSRAFLVLVLPAVVGFCVLARYAITLLAADEYLAGYRAAWLIAGAMFAQGLGELASLGVMLGMQTRVLARNQCIAAVVNVILNTVLISLWGFMGAAISAFLAFALLSALHARASNRYLTWRWPTGTMLRVGLASGVMGIAVSLAASRLEHWTGLPQTPTYAIALLGSMGVGMVVYGGMLWLTGEVSPSTLRSLLRPGDQTVPNVMSLS